MIRRAKSEHLLHAGCSANNRKRHSQQETAFEEMLGLWLPLVVLTPLRQSLLVEKAKQKM